MQRENGVDVKNRNLSWNTLNDIQMSTDKIITDIKASPLYATMLDESSDVHFA